MTNPRPEASPIDTKPSLWARLFKRSGVAAFTVVAGLMVLLPATSANADNPPYSGCPGWAVCMYEHQNGGGSKVIFTPTQRSGFFSVAKAHFLNGKGANDQVTSYVNNTSCRITFMDDAPGPNGYTGYGTQIGYAHDGNYGLTEDWSHWSTVSYANDRLSGLKFYCPSIA